MVNNTEVTLISFSNAVKLTYILNSYCFTDSILDALVSFQSLEKQDPKWQSQRERKSKVRPINFDTKSASWQVFIILGSILLLAIEFMAKREQK